MWRNALIVHISILFVFFQILLQNGEMITTTEGGNPSLQNNIITAVHFLSVGRIGF